MLSVLLIVLGFNFEKVEASSHVETYDFTDHVGEALMIKVDGGVITKITNSEGKDLSNYAIKMFGNIWSYQAMNNGSTSFNGNIMNVHIESETGNYSSKIVGGKDSNSFFDFTNISLESGNYIDYLAYSSDGNHEMRMTLQHGSEYLVTAEESNNLTIIDPFGNEIFKDVQNNTAGDMIYYKLNANISGIYRIINGIDTNSFLNINVSKYTDYSSLTNMYLTTTLENESYYNKRFLIKPIFGKTYTIVGNAVGRQVTFNLHDYILKEPYTNDFYCTVNCIERDFKYDYTHHFLANESASYQTFQSEEDSIALEYTFLGNKNNYGITEPTILYLRGYEYVPKTGDESKEKLKEYRKEVGISAAGDPVDTASGAFYDNMNLLRYGGSDPLEFNIKYNSILNDSGTLANGWVHNYETIIEEDTELVSIFWDPNNKMVFNKIGTEYIARDIRNKEVTLSKDIEGNFIFEDTDNSTYYFGTDGKIKSIEDKIGNLTNFTYDINGRLVKVENEARGQYFIFEYNVNGKLLNVSDRLNRKVSFTYGTSTGNLEKITEANNKVWEFSYISNRGNKIGTVRSNEGTVFVNNTYDELGRVISQRDGRSGTTYFSYDDFSEEGIVKTVVKDRTGKEETFIHDDKFQLIRKIDKNGNSMYKEYDNGNVIKEIDFNNNEVLFDYDENNNLIKETYEDSKYKTFEYDLNNNLIKIVDEDLNETISVYNNNNQLTKVTDSNGNSTDYIYNDEGLLWKLKDSLDNEIIYEYDLEGNLIGLVDKEGKRTSFENDLVGRLIKTILPEGNVTETVYDEKGNIIKVIDINGNYEENTYNSFGQILTKKDKLGRLTTYIYDGNGNLNKEQIGVRSTYVSYDYENRVIFDRDNMDKTHSYVYDNNGRVIKETDRANNVTDYSYDNNGNVIKKTLNSIYIDIYEYNIYDKVTKHINAEGKITLFEYNSKGLLTKETNHLGYSINYTYDSMGNILSEEDAEGRVVNYSYNYLNQLISKTDARGNTWLYDYNKNGLLIKETNPLGQYSRNEYDDNGNLVKVYNSLEEVILENVYDNLGRIILTKDGLGNNKTFEYDKVGNLTSSFDYKVNLVSEYVYNEFDEVIIERDINGNEKKFEYNKNSELIKAIDELNRNQQYRYDAIGRLLEITDKNNVISRQKYNKIFGIENYTDANSYTTNYLYDKLGRLLSETNSNNNKLTYEYNEIGFMTKYTNARNQFSLYEYDNVGNVTKITEGSKITEFEYDENYNLLKVKETGKGIIERTYDELNRVTSYKDVYGNIIGYEYDIRGNISKIIYPGNLNVIYEYDLSGRLIKVTDWHQKVTEYTYDVNGRLIETIKPEGSSEIREYNSKGQLVLLKNINSLGIIISEKVFVYDLVGNIISEGSETYGYDLIDRLLSSNKNKYTYDKAGNLLTYKELVDGTEITDTFTYSNDNRITKAFNITTNLDADGNLLNIPLNGVFTTGVYDSRNRLTSLGNNIYVYDAENIRTSVLENGIETRFLVDKVSNDLSRILLETDNLGNIKNYYVYGLGLINSYEGSNNLDSLKVYHYDMRGSTIALTDKDSVLIGSVEYDTYGEILSKDTSIDTNYLYNGKLGVRTDTSGLYYMRSRYYSPEIKRFINRDVVVGNLEESQTFNRFSYVNGNPISYIDPFGLSRSLGEHFTDLRSGVRDIFYENPSSIVAYELYLAPALDAANYIKDNSFEISLGYASGLGVAVFGKKVSFSKKFISSSSKSIKNTFKKYVGNERGSVGKNKVNKSQYGKDQVCGLCNISRSKHPESAKHVEEALNNGHPDILTINREGAKRNRKESLKGISTQKGKDRDEYPPAMFLEGGKGASVKHIDFSDNRAAGSSIGHMLRPYENGTKIKIRVVD
jgi:RHS repeat-associated protein